MKTNHKMKKELSDHQKEILNQIFKNNKRTLQEKRNLIFYGGRRTGQTYMKRLLFKEFLFKELQKK